MRGEQTWCRYMKWAENTTNGKSLIANKGYTSQREGRATRFPPTWSSTAHSVTWTRGWVAVPAMATKVCTVLDKDRALGAVRALANDLCNDAPGSAQDGAALAWPSDHGAHPAAASLMCLMSASQGLLSLEGGANAPPKSAAVAEPPAQASQAHCPGNGQFFPPGRHVAVSWDGVQHGSRPPINSADSAVQQPYRSDEGQPAAMMYSQDCQPHQALAPSHRVVLHHPPHQSQPPHLQSVQMRPHQPAPVQHQPVVQYSQHYVTAAAPPPYTAPPQYAMAPPPPPPQYAQYTVSPHYYHHVPGEGVPPSQVYHYEVGPAQTPPRHYMTPAPPTYTTAPLPAAPHAAPQATTQYLQALPPASPPVFGGQATHYQCVMHPSQQTQHLLISAAPPMAPPQPPSGYQLVAVAPPSYAPQTYVSAPPPHSYYTNPPVPPADFKRATPPLALASHLFSPLTTATTHDHRPWTLDRCSRRRRPTLTRTAA